jgi:hypothetical protein
MTAIRAELLESHLRITGKNVALIKELKAQIEALELENEAHEDEIAWINDLQDPELAWIADPESEPEIQARHEAILGEDYAQAARDAFQAAEAGAELRRREALRSEGKDPCYQCEEWFKNDLLRWDKDGEHGICADCYDGEYDEEDEDEVQCWQCEGTDTLAGWITYKEGGERHCGYCCDDDGNPYFTCGKCESTNVIEKDMKEGSSRDGYEYDLCVSCWNDEEADAITFKNNHSCVWCYSEKKRPDCDNILHVDGCLEMVQCVGCRCLGDVAHFINSSHGKFTCAECWT